MVIGVQSLENICRLTLAKNLIDNARGKSIVITGEKEHIDIYEIALQTFFPHKSYIRTNDFTIVL